MTSPIQHTNLAPQAGNDDEIDLREVAAALIRQKKLIASIAGTALVLSGLFAFTREKVWEGQFQIVLADKQNPMSGGQALLQANPGLANLVGLSGSGGNALETEVKILESPSVLKPVFDLVKSKRASDGEDIPKFFYRNWLESNVAIELEKGTSVLNLTYQDTDKELILPVLKEISNQYQLYSGKDRKRGISQAILYLDGQINVYRKESINSLRKAQEYAIEQDLTALEGDGENDTEIRNALNVEAIRVQAANEIRNINEQLVQLNALGNNLDSLMYMGQNIPELAAQGLPQMLDAIDTQLALRKAKFTDKDDGIRRLEERRSVLIRILKRQTYGYLQAKRAAAQARMSAAERPKGVLIQYRELLREAAREEATLTKLEAERQFLALEQAREEDPWELISVPEVLDTPVAPRKKRIVALGLLAGLVLGSGAALVIDRRTGLIFSENELKSAVPAPLLERLSLHSSIEWRSALQLMAQGPLKNAQSIGLVPVGQPDSSAIQQFQRQLKQASGSLDIELSQDLVRTKNCDTQLLLIQPGCVSRKQIAQLNQSLALQGTPIAGWVLLDSTMEAG